ncbi:mitochondrial import inner membrane translocase subunit tim21 [Coemansia furcata]|uniref:Mitochondrial import inner membrane translocase subunit tim21 n=1 Tax=Coemansia furcata TaxID=417177 RepID=A0ACC1LPK5_9FUNG|nr:mitochondrial import inner membrane translocase subunit tim21 [Coemansia furcata]
MSSLLRSRIPRHRYPALLYRRALVSPQRPRHYSTPRAKELAGTAGNVLLIGGVATLFGYIMYTLYDNLFAEHGTTRVYNQSLDLVRANPQIKTLFGASITGYGEPSHSQRQRQRAISHRQFVDAQGRQRLYMQYYIEDAKKQGPYLGVVKADLVEEGGTWDYNYVVVDLCLRDGSPGGRVDVFVTDEFREQARDAEAERRNRRFAPRDKSDGSWISVLNPSTWRK